MIIAPIFWLYRSDELVMIKRKTTNAKHFPFIKYFLLFINDVHKGILTNRSVTLTADHQILDQGIQCLIALDCEIQGDRNSL